MKLKIPQMEPWFDKKERKAVSDYLKSGGWLTEYKKTEELGRNIAEFCESRYCVMTVNGTISLIIALLALGIKRGDEVLVPDLTMIATPNAPYLLGIKPILVDVEAQTLCLNLSKAEAALTTKTKALIYVSFNGRSGDMAEVVKFCKNHNLYLIEDAAQAFGSKWQGKRLGTFGDIGSFSFSTPKIITTGQGGALITDKKNLFDKIKKIKDFGRTHGGIDIHDDWGWNFKFTDLQAVIGLTQMEKLNSRIRRKKEIYQRYYDGLKDLKEIEFIPTNLKDTAPWFIDIYISKPVEMQKYLSVLGIDSRLIYPSIASQKIYRSFYKNKRFPVSEKYASHGLWLPSSSRLKNNEIDRVIKEIKRYLL